MENQAATRRGKNDDDDDDVGSDRISQLPESVLLHILCFLSQKKAGQTSVLSKSWRHLGPTRPVIKLRGKCGLFDHITDTGIVQQFCEDCFEGAFLPVLDTTFQRYHHLNISPQELHLEMPDVNSPSASFLLQKWIPIFINRDNHALTTFRLSFSYDWELYFDLPSVVFQAESLRELHLNLCSLGRFDSIGNVLLKNLQKLSLSEVYVVAEDMEKIIAGCPLVKHVVLYECEGFGTIKIANKNHCLNRFEITSFNKVDHKTSFEIDAPTLQSIRIDYCLNWYRYRNHSSSYFPQLRSLSMGVELSPETFNNFSCSFPCLEELSLLYCTGFDEIKLSSGSIKRLVIRSWSPIKKVDVELPNILYFEFRNKSLPTTLSLTTTSREWKSLLDLNNFLYYSEDDVLPRISNLIEMVKALSQSQISLGLTETLNFKINQSEWDFNDHQVVVEHLGLKIRKLCPDSLAHFVNALFRIFRPRYTYAERICNLNNDEEVTKFLWKTLINERGKTEHGWEQYLKEVSIEASDEKEKVWHRVEWTCLPEWSRNQKIRFRLKWRD